MDGTFSPAWGKTFSTANAITATAAQVLPLNCEEVAVANTSTTATVYVMVTPYTAEATIPTGVAPTAANGFPLFPLSQVRLHVGSGGKVIRMLASAADGNTIITPGIGI